ncbi:hypothetical protein PR001_g26384 [Phytophthora rubi]|nr:hypothetical protein PR001_g26384 [Phytophthora rubi]
MVECNLPFSFPENATVRKHVSIPPICTETFLKYVRLVCREVEKDVAQALPAKFGVVFDDCTFKSEQFVGVFAVFEHDNRAETVLLAMAPLVDDEVEDRTAESHVAFLSTILGFFNRTTNDIIFVVGDNCSTNGKVSKLLGVPLVGCASHRLNLAVTVFMGKHEHELEKVQLLMRKLRTLNAAAKLRKYTSLRPALRQDTRWSSTFKMVARFFELQEFLEADDGLCELLPSRREVKKLDTLLKQLKDFESASQMLQHQDGVTLSDVRDIFDELIATYPGVSSHLAADADIVKNPEFEDACVAALRSGPEELTAKQRRLLEPVAVRTSGTAAGDILPKKMSFADRAMKKRKLARKQQATFPAVKFIPPTSNCVERFFSRAKHTLSHHRHGILPVNLEAVLF